MTAASALGWMAAHVGTTEQPPGSNVVPGVTDWLVTTSGIPMGPGPWCAATVSRAIAEAGCTDLFGLQFRNGCAYVPYITRWARDRGRLLPARDARMGDAVIFRWGGAGSDPNGDHIGLAEGNNPAASQMTTWEGNADSNGDGRDDIGRHVRAYSLVLGVVRLAYPDDPTPATADTTVTMSRPPAAAPATFPPGFSRSLSLRTPELHGPDVSGYQQRMIGRGWTGIGRVDGWYGPKADKVTRQFQAEKGLTVDGIAGPATLTAAFRTDNFTK